jgi:hypothetical protein
MNKQPIKLPVSKVTAVIPGVIPIGTKVKLKKEIRIKDTEVKIRTIWFQWDFVKKETVDLFYEYDQETKFINESDIIPDENIIRTTLKFQIPLVSSYTIYRKESGIEKVKRNSDQITGFYSKYTDPHIHFHSSICGLYFNSSGDIKLDLSYEKIIELNDEKCNS